MWRLSATGSILPVTPKIPTSTTTGAAVLSRKSSDRSHTWLLAVALAAVAAVIACSGNDGESDPTPTPAIDATAVGTLAPPATRVPFQQIAPEARSLLCVGPERAFPAHLEPIAPPVDDAQLVRDWTQFLAGTSIVDSNSLRPSFDLGTDGTGVWVDDELRPVLFGRVFDWSVEVADPEKWVSDEERWSDVDLTLSFEDGTYELVLPLRRRLLSEDTEGQDSFNWQIVDPTEVEGLSVSDPDPRPECEFVPPESIDPLPQRIWRPSPGYELPPQRPTIPTSFRPIDLFFAGDHKFAQSDGFGQFLAKFDSDGNVITDFQAARSSVSDRVFDGEFLWIADAGEGQIRKFDLDGNRLDALTITSPGDLAFDGEFLWASRSDAPSIRKLTTDGEIVLQIETPSRANWVETEGGLLWVGLPDEWSVGIYSLEGDLLHTVYVREQPDVLEFDGENAWVGVSANGQVHKISPSGEIIFTVDLASQTVASVLLFDGELMWVIDPCCSATDHNQNTILKYNLDGELLDSYRVAHAADDAEFDGERIWLAHSEHRSFSQIDLGEEGSFWTQTIGPYTHEELNVQSDIGVIGGTLTIPDGEGPHPAVVIVRNINGDGGRDDVIYGISHGPTLADNLARHGLAVYRYDMRGIGESTGRLFDFTYTDLANDLHAIVDAVQAHPAIDAEQVGLWAAGAPIWYASPVVAERDDIKFAKFSSLGAGNSLIRSSSPQLLNLRFTVATEEEIRAVAEHYNLAIETSLGDGDWAEFEEIIRTAQVNDDFGQNLITQQPFLSLRRMQSRWWRSVLEFDTTSTVEAIDDTPYIVFYAGLNLVVSPAYYADDLQAAMDRSGNPDAQIVIIEKANDIYLPARTGFFDEYPLLPQTPYPSFIRPGYYETTTSWIMDRVDFPD